MRRKHTYIWVSFVILIFGIIFVPTIVDRVRSGEIVKNDRMSKLAFIEVNGQKRKVPSFSFINQDSLLITDKDYLGKVYVAEFFFTTCPTICPVMTDNLVELQNEFKDSENFGIVSFTINPRYDTPRVLKEYAEKHGITDLDWHLLTGNKDSIYSLAQNGFYLVAHEDEEAPGGFEHSGMFALIDKKGYFRSRRDAANNPIIYYRGAITEIQGMNSAGEKEQISILKEDIKELLKED
ncbi:SCO family protein [Ulvibacterium sp.]|uniref:SCO family protein n=1 Tax=Ulvibacterium sp. TaxID=2665914 RepID=UPI00261A41D6|nr:SCO family protein [Ulvibacterium sp.]